MAGGGIGHAGTRAVPERSGPSIAVRGAPLVIAEGRWRSVPRGQGVGGCRRAELLPAGRERLEMGHGPGGAVGIGPSSSVNGDRKCPSWRGDEPLVGRRLPAMAVRVGGSFHRRNLTARLRVRARAASMAGAAATWTGNRRCGEPMCGRFTLTSDPAQLSVEFGGLVLPDDYRPRYNIAPTQNVLAVVAGPEGLRAGWLRWGLIPHWAKDPTIGNRLINARAETIAEKPAFRSAFQRRRCLIVADGFYEWARTPAGKRPMWIHLQSRRPFAFAGLWERWVSPEGEEVKSCTIVTTDANPFLRTIHDRMPVILPEPERGRWLDPSQDATSLLELLAPYPSDDLAAYEVSTLVNSPSNDMPELIEPV